MQVTTTVLDKKPENHNLLTLSVSKVKTFKDCKAKFRFSYIERLPRKEWDFHVFGKFLHEILEKFHFERLEGNAGTNNSVMKESIKFAIGKYDNLTEKQLDEAKDIIKEYLARLGEDEASSTTPEVLSVEKDFNIDIDGRILLNGFIDKVQQDSDGILHVADYKTTKNKKYVINDFMQLKTYAYAMCLEDPSLERVRTSYVMLRHKCKPIIKEFTRKEIMKMEQVFLDYADKIEGESLYRPTPNNLCSYCDHLAICDTGRDYVNGQKGFDKFGAREWV